MTDWAILPIGAPVSTPRQLSYVYRPLPSNDPALAIRDIAEAALKRRLVAATRDTPPAPALTALLTAVTDQVHKIGISL